MKKGGERELVAFSVGEGAGVTGEGAGVTVALLLNFPG